MVVDLTDKTEVIDLFKSYINSQSYQKDFKDFMYNMVDKYGIEILNLNGIGEQLDINKAIKKMVGSDNVANSSIDANANVSRVSATSIAHEISKPMVLLHSYYRLWKWLKKNRSIQVANNFVEAQITGAFYVNDMHYNSYPMPYCYNHSCLTIASLGLVGIDDKNNTQPPKYLRSYFDIMEAYLLIAGHSTAGATSCANLLVVASVFVKKMIENGFTDSHVQLGSEEDCWQYFKEELTSFIYKLNQPCRANQTLFTNVSIFDKNFLETIVPEICLIIDDDIYTTDVETVQKCQEIFIDIMNKEAERVVHTFPVTTACFSIKKNEETGKNEILDKEFLEFICRKNEKRGFINMYAGDTATLSSCCRLRSDKNNTFFNSFGGASDSIGSLGVVCINLPQLANKNKNNFEKFKEELFNLTLLAQEVNYAKRCMLKNSIAKGHLPLYSNGYMDLSKQFSTTGFIGLYECCEEFGHDITTTDGLKIATETLSVLEKANDTVSEKYRIPCNLEGIPGENTCHKLALKDKILGYNEKYDLYSNQFIPLNKRCNLLDRINLSSIMDQYCSGGSIMAITVDSKINADSMRDIASAIIEQGVKYFSFNYEINQCKDCHSIFVGRVKTCPECNSENIDKFERVVGFCVKKTSWSKVRQEENRQVYNFD